MTNHTHHDEQPDAPAGPHHEHDAPEADDGLSSPSMQSEDERAGVTPPPQTAADELD